MKLFEEAFGRFGKTKAAAVVVGVLFVNIALFCGAV